MPFAQALHGLEALASWSWRPAAQASQTRARAGEKLPAAQLGSSIATWRTHVCIRNERMTEGGRKGVCIQIYVAEYGRFLCYLQKTHTEKGPARAAGGAKGGDTQEP